MGKNGYLEKQRVVKQGYFDAGLQCGRQQILDMVSLVLRDPDIMGKDDETDYYRFKLDEALEQAYGEKLHDSFLERYRYAPEFDYFKGRWKNG